MISSARFLARVRRVIFALVLASAGYGFVRFDLVALPSGAHSPLYGIHPGDRLLVDRHARHADLDQVWLYRGRAGELWLGRVSTPPAVLDEGAQAGLASGALWLVAERALGHSASEPADSRSIGPIPSSALAGRVLFVLPW